MREGLSIIIPVYNSYDKKKRSIMFTLLSLRKQVFDSKYEIILIDNDSTDKTKEFLSLFMPKHFGSNFQILRCEERGNRSKTRNIGVRQAIYNKILFIDDDVILIKNNVISKALLYLKKNVFLCGAKRFWMVANWSDTEMEYGFMNENFDYAIANSILPCGINRETGYRDLQEFSFIANFGLLYKSDFEEVNGFNENIFKSRREDVCLMYDLLMRKKRFISIFDFCSVIHLTHPMVAGSLDERIKYHHLFRDYELMNGYSFKVSSLFGVFEGEINPVLKPICVSSIINE